MCLWNSLDFPFSIVPSVFSNVYLFSSMREFVTLTGDRENPIRINIQSECNENVDIKFSAHDSFLEQPSSGTLNVERLESQIILKVLGSKPKGLIPILKIGYGHLCLREENLRFNNNYIILQQIIYLMYSLKYIYYDNRPIHPVHYCFII